MRVGYVVKMYPRFSETFIVNEILAHEAAGLDLEIFSLRLPIDGRFHEALARVRGRVTYLSRRSPKSEELWHAISDMGETSDRGWEVLSEAKGESIRDLYQAILLAGKVRARGITHLHAHSATTATTVARLAGHFCDLPYSFTAHAKDIFHHEVNDDELRRKIGNAAAVVTVSDYNLRYLRERYGPVAARVQRVYNGLDLQRFTYSAPSDRPALVVAVGRLVGKKGFADLIDACAVLAYRGREFCCDIIGDGPLKADLQEQVRRLGLEARVRLRGSRPQGEVVERVRKAALLAAPCVVDTDGDRDGLPTVLLEAMALGTPCVSTGVTGIPEVLRDGETGIMVPQHDPITLAGTMERLLDDASLRVQLAAAARRLIEAEFDIQRTTSRMREIMATVAPANKGARQGHKAA